MSTTKTCIKCGLDKFYDPSAKKKSKALGFMGNSCWDCYKEYARSAVSIYRATSEGREKYRTASRVATAKARATPEGKAKNNAAGLAWARNNPGKHNAKSMLRHAAKLQRTMEWDGDEAIEELYIQANKLGMHVDHIFPLQAKWVSGLHVIANLQMLPGPENNSKGNRRCLKLEQSLGYHVG